MYRLDAVKNEYYESIKRYRDMMLEAHSSFDGCSFLERYEDIEKWHLNNLLFENKDTVPPGYSLGYEYLFIEDNEVVGMINIRPEAMSHPHLSKYGGHIGYSIRPDKRNKGLGSLMLKEALKVCKERFKLERVLITCLKGNIGSRKVIINNGGEFDEEILYSPEQTYIERYWISL